MGDIKVSQIWYKDQEKCQELEDGISDKIETDNHEVDSLLIKTKAGWKSSEIMELK